MQFLLNLMTAIPSGMQMLSIVTVAAIPPHRCLVPGEELNATFDWASEEVLKWIPQQDNKLDGCNIFSSIDSNVTEKCTQWVYDSTYYNATRATEWNMICDRRWMGAAAQAAYMLGVLTGAITLGALADKIGRKKILCLSSVLQLVLGMLIAFSPGFYVFMAVKYLLGIFTTAGAYNAGFVLTMEVVGPSKRTACGISFSIAFTAGVCLVSFWAWLISNNTILQLVYGLHSSLLIGHWWLVDESPRWLWAKGRREEAIRVIKKGLKVNGITSTISEDSILQSAPMVGNVEKVASKKGGFLILFRNPSLRKRVFNVTLNWFANSLAYYGLSLNTGGLPGNPFLMLFLVAIVDLPSDLCVSFLMEKIGRRYTSTTFMVAGGLACLISAFIPVAVHSGRVAMITIVIFGKFLIGGSFTVIFTYTTELFPTIVRTSALGIASMGARISGSLTPFIILLDSYDKKLPMVIFATVTIGSGLMALFLPETTNQPIPQSIEDVEKFDKEQALCIPCCREKSEAKETEAS